jgi:hypothetical protein
MAQSLHSFSAPMDVVSMEGNQMTRPVRFWGAGLGSALAFSACSMLTVPPPSHTQSLAVAEEIEVDMMVRAAKLYAVTALDICIRGR